MQAILILLALLIVALLVDRTRKARSAEVLQDAFRTSACTGDAFFRAMVLHLCRALKADYAVITELSPSGTRLRALAVVPEGQTPEPLELANTPFERTLASAECSIADDVRSMFTLDRITSVAGLRSYAGIALEDSAGARIGVMAVMSRSRLKRAGNAMAILKDLAQRTSAEIEHRRSEQTRQESDARTRALLKALPDLMFVLDRNGTYLDFYAGTASELFVSPDQFLGKRFQDLLPTEAVEAVEAEFKNVLSSGGPATVEYELPMPGGTQFYEARMVRLAPDKVLSIVRSLTEKKKAEQASDDTRHFMQQLVETIPSVIYLYDLTEQRTIYVNDRSEAVIGYTAREVLDMGPQFLARTMHPNDLARLPLLAEEYLRAKDDEVLEHVFRFRHKSGEWRWVHRCTRVFSKTDDGRPKQLLGSVTDITDLKVVEQELRLLSARLRDIQDDERRRVARELHDGVAQVLFGIVACLTNLQRRGGLPADAMDELDECGRLCAEGMEEVRLLSYVLHPPLLDEIGLVPALRLFADGLGRRTGIQIDLEAAETAERLPLEIERDLFRIVQEGLSNVVRHSGSRKAVVRLSWLNNDAVLEIQDFGRGMSPALKANEREPLTGGMGIPGMRERLRHVGGRLEVQSSSQGTRLTAIVPLRLEATRP
jgi:PAS domain S-box-containing protein